MSCQAAFSASATTASFAIAADRTNWRVVVSCLAWPTSCRRRRPAHLAITVMSMKPSAANRCADALLVMTGDCLSSRFYRARTTANGSAIRHDRQRRHARLSEPAPPRRVDGDLSPRGLALPLAVVARGANPMGPGRRLFPFLLCSRFAVIVHKMTESAPGLTPADPTDLANVLAYALRFQGRKRVHNADEIMAEIVAKRLVDHLERAGFVMMKKPPEIGAAALGRGFEG